MATATCSAASAAATTTITTQQEQQAQQWQQQPLHAQQLQTEQSEWESDPLFQPPPTLHYATYKSVLLES
ncbi:MAG: hypothetical protein ACKPKO_47655, partial [Candidatus Fonsibacter sp.]